MSYNRFCRYPLFLLKYLAISLEIYKMPPINSMVYKWDSYNGLH